MRKRANLGFSLIEVVFTLTLIGVLAILSMTVLKPAQGRAPSRGLATALAEEFASARQLAISSGRPVALGIPRDDTSPVASSIYRLEGWNLPTITWSKGFSGDYPSAGFAAARWAGGGTWTNGATPSVVSKAGLFDLAQWLPDDLEDDYIFCFTPDGGLVTNGMPALDNRYVVVVGQNMAGSAGAHGLALSNASEPITLFVSPYGGIDTVTGTPGTSLAAGSGAAVTSAPATRTKYEPGEVRISQIKVTPKLDQTSPDNKGVCVPGQFVTLEVYAYDPEGRGLFAKWNQPESPLPRGIFTYPDGGAASGAVLESEVDRMEFVSKPPPGITWSGTTPPAGGLFRARWSWTVPLDSAPGDRYEIEVDVKDALGECEIVNPPQKVEMVVAPKGRIIAEKFIGGIWQLVQLNPDGSNARILSPPGVSETMASIDSTGTKMAFLQGTGAAKYIKVRSLDGGFERKLAGPGNFVSVSLSPNGTWVSYPNLSGKLVTEKVDGTGQFLLDQTLATHLNPPRARSGWSRDSEYLFYESGPTIRAYHMASGVDSPFIGPIKNSYGNYEPLYCPVWYEAGGQERVLYSLGNYNPVLMSVALQRTPTGVQPQAADVDYAYFTSSPGSTTAPMWVDMLPADPGSIGSEEIDDSFPNISKDSKFLILNRTREGQGVTDAAPAPGDDLTVALVAQAPNGNFEGPPVQQMLNKDVRRAIWLP